METGIVCITTKEYAEFIRMQVEHEQLKENLKKEISMNHKLKVNLMQSCVYEWRIKERSLGELIEIRKPYNCLFDMDDQMKLREYGVTRDEMIDFIVDAKSKYDAEHKEVENNG